MSSVRALLFALCVGFLLPVFPLRAADANDWSALLVVRFGNIDAIDAEDGDLALFLKSIRNDGRFTPPMRTLVGPEIRNPTFFGVVFEAWLEGVVLVPVSVGRPELLWVFPVDNRDEYMMQLANHGLSEYEGMDGVTILREMDADGNVHTWHMEWLPGNVAVFGASREAVAAARQLYAENSAARGLLARPGAGRGFLEPDAAVRVFPPRLAAWQSREPGQYWWRESIDRLTNDLIEYWQPSPARIRLIRSLAEKLTLWPIGLSRVELSLWIEPKGVEWTLDAEGAFEGAGRTQLEVLRNIPDRAALAWAVPVSVDSLNAFGGRMGAFLLGAAGGVVTQDARSEARDFFDVLIAADSREVAMAWVPPPQANPELGAARLLLVNHQNGEAVELAWDRLGRVFAPGSPAVQAFAQMGIQIEFTPDPIDRFTADLRVYPDGGDAASRDNPYYHATLVMRHRGHLAALVVGESRGDPEVRRQVAEYRASLADSAVLGGGPGGPDVREAFTRVGAGGASFLAFLEPVRFLQLCLVEAGDWRPRSPDQHEPLSTQLAREMLEYGSERAWTASGLATAGKWTFGGGIEWRSLARLAAALGITESIAMDQ